MYGHIVEPTNMCVRVEWLNPNPNEPVRRLFLCLTAVAFFGVTVCHSQSVDVYRQIPSSEVRATASSSISSSPASQAVDGSGMQGDRHVANNLGEGMWVSEISDRPVRYSPLTHEGAVWFLCEIGERQIPPPTIDQIRIWNHNQNEHTRRGFNKVYIEYSSDGRTWLLLPSSDGEYHVIPESVGRNPEPADFLLETPGLKARFICFTAVAGGEGNHYDRSDSVIMRETRDMHQHPDYYGLAEIRFYQREKCPIRSLDTLSSIELSASQGYLKSPEGPSREFALAFDKPLYAGAELTFRSNGRTWSDRIASSPVGVTRYDGRFPAGYMEEASRLEVRVESRQGTLDRTFDVPAARRWTVCFLPHSHQDIGYTHRQADVMRLQWRNLERAIDLAERTKGYPDGARYRWNTEATWSLMGYLETYAGTERAERVLRAIREGVIHVDATLGSILTGICRQEELMHLFDDAHRIAEMTGVPCTTAMMSDVPGQVWGLATALSQNGVKYYSPGPNYVPFYGKIGNDRAAALHTEWGDRPFWWESQSGTDRVLVWQAGRGYSWFHGWLAGGLSVCGVEPIWRYLQELETDEFPYNTCYLRYTVHGDNGPPDELMPDVIRAWNERYDSPQFRIATTGEFFTDFEKRYGDVLPTYRGDMTPTWEDGAASTARETAMNRESASRLAQSGTLWSMLRDDPFPSDAFDAAWKNVLLFSEHTWGASASGPDPHSQFTRDLWAGKKMYADSADCQSRRLRTEALRPLSGEGDCLHVLNTNLWPRTDVVTLDAATDLTGMRLLDAAGREVAVQRLHDGRWVFVAEEVPALASAVYRIVPQGKKRAAAAAAPSSVVAKTILDNGLLRVELDSADGTIRVLRMAGDPFNYVGEGGLNDYLYTGRIGTDPRQGATVRSIEVLDDGPVAATLRVVSDVPGCESLWRDITLYRGLARVEILNTVDKTDILDFENVRFVFPFNFPHPEVTMDLAMSEMHPEREQLAGVNKHYYSLLNGLSVGDLEHGVCLTSLDAPFVEMGTPSGEDYRLNPRYGYGWWLSAQISPVIYSWVMTNTWRTNYKASQGGVATFRYSLQPGDPFDLKLKQTGLDREQPLIAVRSARTEAVGQLFRLSGRHRIAVSGITPSADGRGYIVRLHNTGKEPVHTSFVWGRLRGREAWVSDQCERTVSPLDPSSFWMQSYEYRIVKIVTE